jgi:hypothetical protein
LYNILTFKDRTTVILIIVSIIALLIHFHICRFIQSLRPQPRRKQKGT